MIWRFTDLLLLLFFIVLGTQWSHDIGHESTTVSTIIMVCTELLRFVAVWRLIALYHFIKHRLEDNDDDS